LKLEEQATGHRATNRKDEAIKSLWKASERFVVARGQIVEANQRLADQRAQAKQIADEQARLKQPKDDQSRQKPTTPPTQPKEEAKTAEVHVPPPVTDKPIGGGAPNPSVPSRADEERAIRATMQRYAAGYSNLNAREVQAVYPSSDLTKAFASYRSYQMNVDVQDVKIAITGTSAIVNALVKHRFQPRVGEGQTQQQKQMFVLQKQQDNTWIIVQLQKQ
jgi:hypothetical protein